MANERLTVAGMMTPELAEHRMQQMARQRVLMLSMFGSPPKPTRRQRIGYRWYGVRESMARGFCRLLCVKWYE